MSIPECYGVYATPLAPNSSFCLQDPEPWTDPSTRTSGGAVDYANSSCYSSCYNGAFITVPMYLYEENAAGWSGHYYSIRSLAPGPAFETPGIIFCTSHYTTQHTALHYTLHHITLHYIILHNIYTTSRHNTHHTTHRTPLTSTAHYSFTASVYGCLRFVRLGLREDCRAVPAHRWAAVLLHATVCGNRYGRVAAGATRNFLLYM